MLVLLRRERALVWLECLVCGDQFAGGEVRQRAGNGPSVDGNVFGQGPVVLFPCVVTINLCQKRQGGADVLLGVLRCRRPDETFTEILVDFLGAFQSCSTHSGSSASTIVVASCCRHGGGFVIEGSLAACAPTNRRKAQVKIGNVHANKRVRLHMHRCCAWHVRRTARARRSAQRQAVFASL